MFKKTFLIIAIVPLLAFGAMTANQQKEYEKLMSNYDMQGPSGLYSITAECDKKNLESIEAKLKGEEFEVVEYNYTLYLIIRESKVSKVEIRDYEFGEDVKTCVENTTLNTIKLKKLPPKGLIPIGVKFPAFITKKSEN